MKCEFCTNHTELRCAWKCMKEVQVPIENAEVGDVWVTKQAGKHARIVNIEDLDHNGKVIERDGPLRWKPFARRFWIAVPGHPTNTPYPYVRYSSYHKFTTLSPGLCAAPCCEAHAREVDHQVHYCQNHWRAWEEVA